jgi:hypothetical protein
MYARHIDIDEYNSILADNNTYIDDNHANDDLDEFQTKFIRESYTNNPPIEAPN